jgi:hypothetical protein
MKQIIFLIIAMFFIGGFQSYSAQIPDSLEQEESVLPPTSKSKQADDVRYSAPPKSKSNWGSKIYLGGYFGMTFGSYTNIELSPIVGYNFTKDFSMGFGIIYSYYSYNTNLPTGNAKISSSNWGFRVNANYVLLKFIRLGAEYQYLSVDTYNGQLSPDGSPIYDKEPYNILFLGGGINQRMGGHASMFIMFYYDIFETGYYYNNYIFRVGVAAGF